MLSQTAPADRSRSLRKAQPTRENDELRNFFASAPAELRLQILHDVLSPVPYAYEVPLTLAEAKLSGQNICQVRHIHLTCIALLRAGNRQLYHDIIEVLEIVRVEISTIIEQFPNPEESHWSERPHWQSTHPWSPGVYSSLPRPWLDARSDSQEMFLKPTWSGHDKDMGYEDLEELYRNHCQAGFHERQFKDYSRYMRQIRVINIPVFPSEESDMVLRLRRLWRLVHLEVRSACLLFWERWSRKQEHWDEVAFGSNPFSAS